MLSIAGDVVCLFVLANVRQYLEMGGVTGWHVTTIRRWHDLL